MIIRAIPQSRAWLKHSVWNLLEHGVTRAADAGISFILLWILSPEIFSKLALAQAVVVPLLFFFIAPETVIYRDFAIWKNLGPDELASRLRAFRLFAFGKGWLALGLSLLIASLGHDWNIRFWSLIWAFSLVLSPQISGPDREFLRLDLQLPVLNGISLYQKGSLVLGTVFAAIWFPGKISALALVAAFSCLSTAVVAHQVAVRSLRGRGATDAALSGRAGIPFRKVLSESLLDFSLWQHFNGVIVGWIQVMDLFFLGVFRFPARALGLYAAVLKLANIANALPVALSNTFSLWVGRRLASEGRSREKLELARVVGLLSIGVIAQAVVIYLAAPWFFALFSHGRWSTGERAAMLGWLKWILAGSSLFAVTWPINSWLIARANIRSLFLGVFMPAGACAVLIYVGMILKGGISGAAAANVFVSISYIGLLWLNFRRA